MKMKKDKLIGLSDSDKKELAKMGIDVGLSLKAYCERVLERHVLEHAKPENIRNPKMLTTDECFKPVEEVFDTGKKEIPEKKKRRGTVPIQSKPMDIVRQTAEIAKEEESFTDIRYKVLPPDEAKELAEDLLGINNIPAKNKKGKFERVEMNIYTNGIVFEYRRMAGDEGLISDYFKTLEEAKKEKENNGR
jgi:hypothetical protein